MCQSMCGVEILLQHFQKLNAVCSMTSLFSLSPDAQQSSDKEFEDPSSSISSVHSCSLSQSEIV